MHPVLGLSTYFHSFFIFHPFPTLFFLSCQDIRECFSQKHELDSHRFLIVFESPIYIFTELDNCISCLSELFWHCSSAVYVQVTGDANESQVCEALRRYRERECFIREALVHLYNLTTDIDQPRPDLLKVPTFILFFPKRTQQPL